MKLKAVVELYEEFQVLFANYKIGLAEKYRFERIARLLRPHAESFRKLQEDYIKEHGELKDGVFALSKEQTKVYLKEIDKVLEETIDVVPNKIKLADLESIKGEGLGTFPLLFELIEE